MKNLIELVLVFIAAAPISAYAWPDLNIKDLGKELAGRTGIASASQVDAVLQAGEKISESSRGLTNEQEYYLGRSVSAMILRQYPLYSAAPEQTTYLNQVGNALSAKSDQAEIFGGYHFSIIDTEEINALSAPGGFIFVSRGFLKLIPDEEALAAVLAHEIGHIALRHGVNSISQAKMSEAMLILGKEAASSYGPSELATLTDAFGASVDQIFETLIKNGYSRSQEYDADRYAVNLMVKSGYSAKGLLTMFDQLHRVNEQSRGGWRDTHPSPQDRKANLALPKQSIAAEALEIRGTRFKTAFAGG